MSLSGDLEMCAKSMLYVATNKKKSVCFENIQNVLLTGNVLTCARQLGKCIKLGRVSQSL
jgi:hypothetical protein